MSSKKVSKQSVRRTSKQRREEQKRQQAQRRKQLGIVAVVGVVVLGLGVIIARSIGSGEEDRPLAEIEPSARNNYYSDSPDLIIDRAKEYEAVIRTEKGDMRFRLFAADAPLTVNNFVFLATQGFYDDTVFHRVIPDFMAQAGDPTGTGSGGPGYKFEDETDNGLSFDRPGLLAMANRGPDTNGSQFFVTFAPKPHLNGLHTIFGELVEGTEVLNSITFVQPGNQSASGTRGDVIERIDITEK